MAFPVLLLSLLVGLTPLVAAPAFDSLVWKAVLVSGDDSAEVFDHARLDLGKELFLRGVRPSHLLDLSAASDDYPEALRATYGNLRYALGRLEIGPGDACFVHLTSHGTREGLVMAEEAPLAPEELGELLDDACGGQPTVVLVSACYSGVFLDDESMRRPNRVVLTASRADRTSFGCDDRGEYNFWDECLLEHFRRAENWAVLHREIVACISAKEKAARARRSYPQAFVGEGMKDRGLPRPSWYAPVRPDTLAVSLWGPSYTPIRRASPPDYAADDVCE